jgi:hypothetical protein
MEYEQSKNTHQEIDYQGMYTDALQTITLLQSENAQLKRKNEIYKTALGAYKVASNKVYIIAYPIVVLSQIPVLGKIFDRAVQLIVDKDQS